MKRFFFLSCFVLLLSAVFLPDGSAQGTPYSRVITAKYKTYGYYVFLPNAYAAKGPVMPLVLYLHGAGERGTDLTKVYPAVPYKYMDEQFIVVAPQCPSGRHWSTTTLKGLMDSVIRTYRVDTKRMYITGYSMGGYGTWDMICRYPTLFAAAAPAAGGGNPQSTKKIVHLPTWVFHGKKDDVVPFSESERMVNALKRYGGNVQFTVFPDLKHGIWKEVYSNKDLYAWFLQQRIP